MMKKYKIAVILMIIHGAFMEIGGGICLIPTIILGSDKIDISQYFSFILPYLQQNLYLMAIAGIIYGMLRVIGAIGLWKNKMWGLVLCIINCVVTMALMIFMLPVGIIDGILAGISLLLILTQYFGDKRLVNYKYEEV